MRSKNQPRPESEQFEKIKTDVYSCAGEASNQVARETAELVREKNAAGRPAVLGLATGSTPVRLYRELIRLHEEEGLSFKNVITFNLDEYYPLPKEHRESYWRFMQEQLFQHIDIPEENIHMPPGDVPRNEVFQACRDYEQAIRQAGGIDLQILGIGRTGHIGFNEPGSARDSRARLVSLDRMTRQDAARDFLGEANVPHYALTMGVGTILEARRIILLAWGGAKAKVVARAVEGPVTEAVSASFLQGHPHARFIVDKAAAGDLTRFRLPWLAGPADWTPPLVRRAAVWLSGKTSKPILKLLDENYSENGLGSLLTEEGPAYQLNIRLFNEIQHTITGWPGGKPNADDTRRPERASPFPKRVLVFSPEPQDAVLCLGGTLNRLVMQGHSAEVIYQTSGNLGVPDEEAWKFAEVLAESFPADTPDNLGRTVMRQLETKNLNETDPPETRRLKGLIRREEARAACQVCGVAKDRIHFLDLPFYEKGRYRRFNLTKEDADKMTAILEKFRPHQIYAMGQGADPASVPGLCFESLRRAVCKAQKTEWFKDCRVWMSNGTAEEWALHEIDMAVPLSPAELAGKIKAIYQHQSQRSQAPHAPEHLREAWQQAESRNRETAQAYDRLGLAEYEALEAFKLWQPNPG